MRCSIWRGNTGAGPRSPSPYNRSITSRKIGSATRPPVSLAPRSRGEPLGPCSDPHFANHSRQAVDIYAIVGEEPFVFGGKDGVADHRRNVAVSRDVAALVRQLDEWPPVAVVDPADRLKLEAVE